MGATGGFERLYKVEHEKLWRSLLLFAGDPDVASDATAEAFTQALRRWDDLRDPRSWVWRAGFRIAAGELQVRRRMTQFDDPGSYEMPESVIDFLGALATLSPRQRQAVVLHYYGGYRLGQIATMTGSTAAAMAVHLHRARRKLREKLEAGDG